MKRPPWCCTSADRWARTPGSPVVHWRTGTPAPQPGPTPWPRPGRPADCPSAWRCPSSTWVTARGRPRRRPPTPPTRWIQTCRWTGQSG
ncbi:hypothetical protein ACFFX0_07795 [Citricoccus parietis]|uniref:Uncharacterized protein n=1 Tax=Citricoccus parietis TaxID=592307 RepID=A0ABV5FWN0_9MICC